MKKIYSIIVMGTLSILLSACSSPITTNVYTPQNYVKIDNSVNLGKFTYLPAELGVVKVNQIENVAIGNFLIDTPVVDVVQKATALELSQSGIKLGSGDLVLEGRIKKLKINDIGFNVDWIYIINYKIMNNKNNTILLDKEYLAEMRTTKFVASMSEVSNFLNKIIALGFEKFINDYDARKALEKNK